MRIALTSDTHLFVSKAVNEARFRRLIKRMRADRYDIGAHCGDWNGGARPWRCVEIQCEIIREEDPVTPWVVTTGNHDCWWRGKRSGLKPDVFEWTDNRRRTAEVFEKFNMHFIDNSIYRDDRFPNWAIVGSMGWYTNPNPPTNDKYFLPFDINGCPPNHFLLNEQEKNLIERLNHIQPDENVVFMSHFPVINPESPSGHKSGSFKDWSWSERIGEMMQESFNCKYFLTGHAHEYHNGPLRYECGSGVYRISGRSDADMAHIIVEVR